VHARSALFDLLGDHVRPRGGEAPVAALVRMLAPLDVSAAAVRTAVSRMVRQGWLRPVRTPGGPGYAITDRARVRLDDAARRIYRTAPPRSGPVDGPVDGLAGGWDGSWDLLVLDPVRSRSARERLRAALGFLGYAPLGADTWIAAGRAPDLVTTLESEGAQARRFRSVPEGDPVELARAVWDLDALADAYRGWQGEAERWVADEGETADEERQFALRSMLVHEWRKFLFRDPGLPAQLLPSDWPGHQAAAFFDREAARLAPAAGRFVDACLNRQGDTR
jgi:phenylacetic acid degradation operon negative regulatory protein